MSLQSLDQRIFFFRRACIVVALFCSEDFIFRITFVRITFESCTFLLFKCRNNLEVILTTESPEWLSSHLHTGWILLVLAAQECSIPSSHLLSVVSAVLSLRGCERREKQINMAEGCYEYTISVSGKVQSLVQFSLDLSKESLQKVLLSCQSCAPRILNELSKPKALQTFPHATAALQGGVGAVPCSSCGQQQEELARGTVIF